jgi:hypothetical protein
VSGASVREFKLDFYLGPEARQTFDGLYGLHQEDIARRIDYLCQRPEPDDEYVFSWPEDGPNSFIFYDEAWLLIFSLENDGNVLAFWVLTPAGRSSSFRFPP